MTRRTTEFPGRRTRLLLLPGVLFGVLLAAGCADDAAPASGATSGGTTSTSPERPAAGVATSEEPVERVHHDRGRFRFVDGTEASGLGAFQQVNGTKEKLSILGSVGGGVGLLDVDRDGDLDAYLSNGSRIGMEPPLPKDALFVNDGSARFTDASEAHGVDDDRWSMGLVAIDVDADGWRDVYLLNFGANRMLVNHEGRFVDEAPARGLDDAGWGCGAGFGDYDRDGDLDLYLSNYVEFDVAWTGPGRRTDSYRGAEVYAGPRGLPAQADVFLRNRGDGTFEDVSEAVGIRAAAPSYGFAVLPIDLDGDGWLDVYVANDSEPNFLWRNQGDGTFVERAIQAGLAVSMSGRAQAGMGAAVGDFDGDLVVDLFVTNFAMDSYTMYRGSANGVFQDATRRTKLHRDTYDFLGWACGFEDFDADGDEDLWMVNGHVYPQVDRFNLGSTYLQENLLFENRGDGSYERPDGLGGSGFGLRRASRGGATGDVDGDGDVDLLVGNIDDSPTLLINETARLGGVVRVRVVGAGELRDAIGARILVASERKTWLRTVGANVGFLSAHEPGFRVGVGDDPGPFRVTVQWPDGTTSTREGVPVGADLELVQPASR